VLGLHGEYFLDLLDGEFWAEVNGLDGGGLAGVAVWVIAQEGGAEEFVGDAVGGGEADDLHGRFGVGGGGGGGGGSHGKGPWVGRGWGMGRIRLLGGLASFSVDPAGFVFVETSLAAPSLDASAAAFGDQFYAYVKLARPAQSGFAFFWFFTHSYRSVLGLRRSPSLLSRGPRPVRLLLCRSPKG